MSKRLPMALSHQRRLQIYNSHGGRCWYCGTALTIGDSVAYRFRFTIDHVKCQDDGGSHDSDNLVQCCGSCNSRKRNKSLDEYREVMKWHAAGCKRFSDCQIEYLESRGVDISLVMPEQFTFSGESSSQELCKGV